jgi:hypothetical protein
MNQPTRAEHLQWCKDRALEYVELGDLDNAIASMQSDLNKHPETQLPMTIKRATDLQIIYRTQTKQHVINWINGFN